MIGKRDPATIERHRRKTPLVRRLALALATMLLPLVAVAMTGILTFRGSVGALENFRNDIVDQVPPIEKLRTLLIRADDVGENYVESNKPGMAERFDALSARIDAAFEELTSVDRPEERQLAILARTVWESAEADVAIALLVTSDRNGDRLDLFHDAVDGASARVADLYSLNVGEVAGELATLRRRAQTQLVTGLGALLLGSIVALGLVRRLRRSISAPLRKLEEAAAHFGSDHLSYRLAVHGDDELARVGESFNAMAAKLQQSREDLHHQALHDPLTGLANRSLFMERLGHAVVRARRRNTPFSVLYLDLDGFKEVNDTLGHESGDQALTSVAKRLTECLRDEDTVARLGGDEFGILLEEADAMGAAEVAGRLIDAFLPPLQIEAGDVAIGASLGATTWSGDEEVDELLRQADAAMYAAKASGKGQWCVFGPSLNAGVLATQTFRTELQRALDREEFLVHYQPIVNLRTGAIAGLEALVRWQHPERGLLFPADFLEEAEAGGQILHIDRWVMRTACRQVAAWQEQFAGTELSVCVNLSARQLHHAGLVDEVAATLRSSGLASQDLVLELTETVLVRDTQDAAKELSRLKDLGVRLALDDFGTGYSSLNYLLRFPIDIIKIDRSFVSAMGTDDPMCELAPALVKLAKTLSLRVVAEGIETSKQLHSLSDLDCELGQGYYFAKPLSADELEKLLHRVWTPEPAVAA